MALNAIATSVLSLPLSNASALVLMGFEPHEETFSTNIFGTHGFRRPGYIAYVRELYRRAGWAGLYKGWAPVSLNAASSFAAKALLEPIVKPAIEAAITDKPEGERTIAVSSLVDTLTNLALSSSVVIASQPFHVLHLRMLATVVGGETSYSTLASAAKSILSANGIAGFYSGLGARLVYTAMQVTIIGTLAFCIRSSGIVESIMQSMWPAKEDGAASGVDRSAMLRMYERILASLVGQRFFHPFNVVQAIMTINGTELALAQEPYNNSFGSWRECLSFFHNTFGWSDKRGLQRLLAINRFYKTMEPTTLAARATMHAK